MSGDVRTRLSEALDQAEKRGRELLVAAQRHSLAVKEPRLLGREIPGWHDWPDVEAMCARELRMVERDRQLLADYDQTRDNEFWEPHGSAGGYAAAVKDQLERAAAFWLGTPEGAGDGSAG